MFGSNVLEIGMGLVFVYLCVSLICTATNELIAAALRSRAANLERGIRNLLDGTSQFPLPWWRRLQNAPKPSSGNWADDLFKHHLVNGMSQGDDKPSYLPSKTFATALIALIAKKPVASAAAAAAAVGGADSAAAAAAGSTAAANAALLNGLSTFEDISNALAKVSHQKLKETLESLLEVARMDRTDVVALQKFQTQIEVWYDHAMDRVSGWYRRKTRGILLVIALVAVALLNVDTVAICRALSKGDALRKSVVAAAEARAKSAPPASPAPSTQPLGQGEMDAVVAGVDRLTDLGLPVGWRRWTEAHLPGSAYGTRDDSLWDVFHAGGLFLNKVFGLLATAIAASLGAPFWFDVLNKFMSVRSAGRAPEERLKDPKVVLKPQAPGQ